MRINGQIIQSYFVCKRQTWFLLNHISMSHESDLMREGKLIHDRSFRNERKNIIIDGEIAIDFRRNRDKMVIFEVKKSSKMIESARWQVYYYLIYLKKKGINASGVLTFPEERRRENLVITADTEKKFEEIVSEIKKISELKNPPAIIQERYCNKCSYHNMCRA